MLVVHEFITEKSDDRMQSANYGDLSFFERLLAALEKPYEDRPEFADYTVPPKPEEALARSASAFRPGLIHVG